MPDNLLEQFGNIDIYLFDQLLKGRIDHTQRILDAGCGGGRNLIYLLKQGYDVHAVDQNLHAVDHVKHLAAELAPDIPQRNFQQSLIEHLPYPDQTFDVVISNAVLHFCRDSVPQIDTHINDIIIDVWVYAYRKSHDCWELLENPVVH